jgi:uncharacterized membrane protein AbrB (regulator of aidB expression)
VKMASELQFVICLIASAIVGGLLTAFTDMPILWIICGASAVGALVQEIFIFRAKRENNEHGRSDTDGNHSS